MKMFAAMLQGKRVEITMVTNGHYKWAIRGMEWEARKIINAAPLEAMKGTDLRTLPRSTEDKWHLYDATHLVGKYATRRECIAASAGITREEVKELTL